MEKICIQWMLAIGIQDNYILHLLEIILIF